MEGNFQRSGRPGVHRRIVRVLGALFVLLAITPRARAEQDNKPSFSAYRRSTRDAPASPSLPDLTHRATEASADLTFASVQPTSAAGENDRPRVAATFLKLHVESTVSKRRWYVGIGEEVARGQSMAGDEGLWLASNPELWGRALWASTSGLAYGGGIAIVPPLLEHGATRGPSVEGTLRVVNPFDYAYFAGRSLVFRPFVDMRDIDGPVILQVRQGIDITRSLEAAPSVPPSMIVARGLLYVGLRPHDLVGLGVEISELYFIEAEGVTDSDRAVFSVASMVRWMNHVAQPALIFTVPIERPLFGQATSYWALTLDLQFILQP